MKKLTLLVFILILSQSILAQNNGWKFSIGIDPMITWISAKDDLKSEGPLLGFDFSLYAENYFHERYAFYTGLSFINTGGKVQNSADALLSFNHFNLEKGTTATIRAQYLAIPVGIKLHTAEFGQLSYYFNAGLYTGIRVGGSVKSSKDTEKYTANGDVNLITAGGQLGAGVMYKVGSGNYLQGGLKLNYGFVDILQTKALNGQSTGIGLHLGFVF